MKREKFASMFKESKFGKVAPAVVVVAFILTGILILASSDAASPYVALEPEQGTVTAPAATVSDATASGSSAVKFATSAGGGSCPVSTPNKPDGPDPWGGCFPGPQTTGVPAGTTLTNYTGPCLITTDNTVIDSKSVNCPEGLGIMAGNVMIKNSTVNHGVGLDGDRAGSTGWSVTIQDSEVNGGPEDLPAVGAANITVIRSELFGGHNGLQCDEKSVSCTMRDSYIHGQYQPQNYDSHLGGFLSDGTHDLTITHNTVACDAPVNNVGGGCTGDINLIPNFAAISGALINKNLLVANVDSSFCTYGGEKPPSPTPHSNHIVYQDNIFQRGSNGKCGGYGPVANFDINQPGNQWTNNKWDDGAVVPPEL